MSRHEGVSCDSCLKGNFRGKRYKCLICYDYDLCATCYEAGATTTRHTTDHPVQCILTRTDFEVYYAGEALTPEQPQSFTCPYCGRMGLTETTLHEHVTADHAEATTEVVCPICASLPGGDPNHVTDDFTSHLGLEHRTPRDFDEPPGMRHVRRIPHPSRGVSGSRTRRANMHFASTGTTLTGLSPSGRETMDPIAELLSQLSSVRNRAAAAQSVSSQLQQLEMQLQSTRNPTTTRAEMYESFLQQLERLPRRQTEGLKTTVASNAASTTTDPSSSSNPGPSSSTSQFLLAKLGEGEVQEGREQGQPVEHEDRGMFMQELLLATLTGQLQLEESSQDPSALLEALRSPDEEQEEEGATQAQAPPQQETRSPAAATENLKVGTGPAGAKTVAPRPVDRAPSTPKPPPSGGSPRVGSGSGGSTGVRPAPAPAPAPLSSTLASSASGLLAASGVGGGSSGGGMVGYPPQGRMASPREGREGRMNPASAKRNMLKHNMQPTRASDTEPPPH